MAIYHEDIADINLNGGSLHRNFKTVSIGSGDQDANRFGMRTFRDGEPVDLTGVSCQAVFQDPMGNNIALTSHGTVTGNKAFVTLPQECYQYEGRFCLAIKLIGGGVTGTMRIVDGVINNTHTGGTVAPMEAVPTYQEVLAAYDAAIAAVDDVNDMKVIIDILTEETENLMPLDSCIDTNTKTTLLENGYKIESTKANQYLGSTYWIDVREIESITISWKKYTGTGSGGIRIARMNADKEFVSWIGWATDASAVTDTTGGAVTYDVSEESYIGVVLFSVRTANQAIGAYIIYDSVQVNEGETATEYRPPISAVDTNLRLELEAEKEIVSVDDFGGTLANTDNWEAGTLNSSTGEEVNQQNSIRTKKKIRTKGTEKLYIRIFYETPDSTVEVSETDNYNYRYMYLYQYEEDGTFIGRQNSSDFSKIFTLAEGCEFVRLAIYTRLVNTNLNVIMPPTIDFYSADDEHFLPHYYDDYLSSKAAVIEGYARAAGGDGAVFAFITDQHSPEYNQDWSPAILHRLAELAHIPVVFNGGDLSHTGANPYHYANLQRENYDGEIHHAVGNHDFLSLTLGQSLYYDMDIYNTNQIGSVDHHYYYVDNEQLKIRFIVLAAYAESKKALDPEESDTRAQGGYTTEQINWINNTALDMPQGWKAIVFTHYFYMLHYDGEADPEFPATLSYGTSILRSLNENGDVICAIQGHIHNDRIIKNHGTGEEATWGMPVILCTCDKNRVYVSSGQEQEHWMVNRASATIYEQAFDVMIINQKTRKITAVRIGGLAEDGVNDDRGEPAEVREISY